MAETADPRLTGFAPVVAPDARLLLLGSFPGDASLAAAQYYAHPRNQFWPLLAELTGIALPALAYDERLDAVKRARIAIWDVNQSCRRIGSLDSAIRSATVNPFAELLARAPGIAAVGFNGQAAARHQDWFEAAGLRTYRLPSTSPAHASLSFAQKLERWSVLRDDGWIVPQA
ncbi:MAG: DNA-deoxyinosine glycosylase [Burkholderiaceae bacterium]